MVISIQFQHMPCHNKASSFGNLVNCDGWQKENVFHLVTHQHASGVWQEETSATSPLMSGHEEWIKQQQQKSVCNI